jgi:pilus assembly protein CpaF
MAKRLSDRLAGNPAGAKTGNINEVSTRIRRLVIDRIDHNALAQVDEAAKRSHLQAEVERLLNQDSAQLSRQEREAVVQTVLDEILGLGPLEVLLSDPEISDILVNGPDVIYVERRGRLERTDTAFRDNTHLVNTISRIAAKVGRRVDESSPIVDARLPDGSRVNAIIPPLALDGAALSIRRFGAKALSVDDLVSSQNATSW